jgi:hypothetical protein
LLNEWLNTGGIRNASKSDFVQKFNRLMARLDKSKEIAMKIFLKQRLPNYEKVLTLMQTNRLSAYEDNDKRRARI